MKPDQNVSFSDDSTALKLVLAGDGAVGKTSLCKRLANDFFPSGYDLTVGCEIHSKKVPVSTVVSNGSKSTKSLSLVLWDLAGQSHFEETRKLFYKGTKGALVVFDVTSRGSFYDVSDWVREIRRNAPEAPFVLVGNKADKKDREVSRQEGEELAKKLGVPYLETSAQTSLNVETVFTQITRLALQNDKDVIGC